MKRREFIVRSAVAALAPGTLAACGRTQPAALEGWAAVRESFALREGDRTLTALWFATHPEPVRAAVERHRAGLDADSRHYLTKRETREDDVRTAAATYRVVASVTPYRDSFVRVGPSIVNDEEDVDVTARALRELS